MHCINRLRVVHDSFFRHRRASLDAAAMADIVCGMCGLAMETDLEFTLNTSHGTRELHRHLTRLSLPCNYNNQQRTYNEQLNMVSWNTLSYSRIIRTPHLIHYISINTSASRCSVPSLHPIPPTTITHHLIMS